MQTQLQEYINDAKTPYIHEIVHRAFDFDTDSDGSMHTSVQEKTNIQTRDIKQAPVNRMIDTVTTNWMHSTDIQKGQTRQGTPHTGKQGSPPSGRQGGPPSSRQGGSGPPKGSGSTRGGGGTSNRR